MKINGMRALVRHGVIILSTLIWFSPPSLADIQRRYFHFSNGNKAIFTIDTENPLEGRLDLLEPGDNGDTLPIFTHFNYKNFLDHEDSQNTELTTGVVARRADSKDSHFTWFESKDEHFLLFQDGRLARSCTGTLGQRSAFGAVQIDLEGKSLVIETFSRGASAGTFISSLGLAGTDPLLGECVRLDHEYHSHLPQMSLKYKNGLLSLSGIEAQIELSSMALVWNVVHQGITYFIKSISDLNDLENFGHLEGGVFIFRSNDGKAIKIQDKAITIPTGEFPVPLFEIKSGLLKVNGIKRKIDLNQFDAESRVIKRQGKADPLYDRNNLAINAAEAVLKNYKDWVQESLLHPENFKEKADPLLMENMGEAIVSGRSLVVLGKAGTGKTSAVRAFAREVGAGRIPGVPRTTRIIEIKVANLASGTTYTGMIEERVATLIAAAKELGCIFFFDEIHSLAGVGTSKHQQNDITQYMKGPLETGELILIGTDTPHEFNNVFGKDPAFMQRFKQVRVSSPTGGDLIQILRDRILKEGYPLPSNSVLEAAIDYSNQYDLTAAQPRSAINLLRTAYAKTYSVGLGGQPLTREVLVRAVIAEYKVDTAQFSRSQMRNKLQHLSEGLNSEIIGQASAKEAIIHLWRRKLTGVGDADQVNSLLLAGPSGIGKSKVAEISANLMGYEKTTIEMNKYRLGGVDKFRREVYSALLDHPLRVIILDELEKAGIEVQQAALSMLQNGEFTVLEEIPGGGTVSREVSARHCLFILTTNAASRFIARECGVNGKCSIPDKHLAAAMVGEIDQAILSRIQDIVPMTFPSQKEFEEGLVFYVRRTLLRESQRHRVQFTIKRQAEFLKALSQLRTSDSEFRDAKKLIAKVLERSISESLLRLNSAEEGEFDAKGDSMQPRVLIELDWNPKNWPVQAEKTLNSMYI